MMVVGDVMDMDVGRIIGMKRREKGVTQDALAAFVGVSKSSVSKWETGQSLPDIALLPRLASYFNTGIDELMGYEPQMTAEDISKLYEELARAFAVNPFDEAVERCRGIVKKYYSCFPLLFRMGLLLTNYGWAYSEVSADGKPNYRVIEEAKTIFLRVREHSGDMELKQLALNLEATCAMFLGKPDEIIGLLRDVKPPPPHGGLLAQAYVMTGKTEEAKALYQKMIFVNMHNLVKTLPAYLTLCADDCLRLEEVYKRASILIDTFNLKELDPLVILPVYITAAKAFMQNGKAKEALDLLETYTDMATGISYPPEILKGDEFFDKLKQWEGEQVYGQTELPRDENSIRKSIAVVVTENPAFSALRGDPRYEALCKKLQNNK